MDGRHSHASGPSSILGSLGPSHQWRHKSRASLRGPPCAHGVAGTPQGEVRKTYQLNKPKDLDEKWASFFYDANVPFNVGRHPLFVVAANATASVGFNYKPPLSVFMTIGATGNMLRSFFESFLAYFIEYFFQKCHEIH